MNWWKRRNNTISDKMRLPTGILFLLSALLLFGRVVFAQSVTYRQYSTANGLPSATVYYIMQDKEGFMWFGTEAGVSRFDGRKFTNYTLADGLSENEILTVAQDSRGRIWFLGFNGTLSYYYRGKIYNKSNDSILAKVPFYGTYLYFYEDGLHRLWFSTTLGYVTIDGANVHTKHASEVGFTYAGLVYSDNKNNITYVRNWARNYTYPGDGSLIYSSGDSIMRLDDSGAAFLLRLDKEIMEATPAGMALSGDNKLWISTGRKGIYCYDLKDPQGKPEHFMDGAVMSTMNTDNEGNIWVGTINSGAYMVQPWHGRALSYNAQNSTLPTNIYSVTRANNGTFFAGADGGKIFSVTATGVTELPVPNRTYPYDRVVKLLVAGDDLYAGTDKGVIRFNAKKNINVSIDMQYKDVPKSTANRAIKGLSIWKGKLAACEGYAIYTDSMLSTDTRKHTLISLNSGMTRKYAVFSDADSILWYSTTDGLYRYDGHMERHYPTVSGRAKEKITDMTQARDKTLILATFGNGLLFCRNDSVLRTFTKADGLTNDICKRVTTYGDRVFVATAGGITAFTYKDGNISNVQLFTTANGLASDNVNDLWANDTVICAATSGGLTFLNIAAVQHDLLPPTVYITMIKTAEGALFEDSTYELGHRQNSLHFDFIGLSYRSASSVRYRYRLDPDQRWQETDNTSVDYSSLPPGDYRFDVSARIQNGDWSGPVSFSFTIKPPWWRTWWFLLSVGMVLKVVLFVLFRYRVRANARKEGEKLRFRDQVTMLEQQALQAMMNPHFIFNVMNTIQDAINNSDQHNANVYLSDFARLIRMNLDTSMKRYITLEEEIAYLELYLSLEKIRFGDRLTYAINVAPDIDEYDTLVPVMLLQPFIENAIWHGILPLEQNGHVQIDITRKSPETLMVTITDNGIGRQAAAEVPKHKPRSHISRGMQLTQQRVALLRSLTGKDLSVTITDATPLQRNTGTKVSIVFPGDLE